MVSGRRNPLHYGLANRLKRVREQADLPAARLSMEAGLATNTVFYIEDEGRVPLLDTVERLARALKISPCSLAFNVDAAPTERSELACMSVGQRLAQARAARGESRKGLAKLAALSTTAISNIEDRGHMPSVATVEKLAKALGCDPCWLGYDAGTAPDKALTSV